MRPVRNEGGCIVNTGALTVDDVAHQRVLCPACGSQEFVLWPEGWDAHAAHRCEGIDLTDPELRKREYRSRFAYLFRDAPAGRSEMKSLDGVVRSLLEFRDRRNWQQFHNSKDLALALSIEAAELNELFLWKRAEEVDPHRLTEELADVFTFALLLAQKHGLDPAAIVAAKIVQNEGKYPVDKAYNNAKKHDEL